MNTEQTIIVSMKTWTELNQILEDLKEENRKLKNRRRERIAANCLEGLISAYCKVDQLNGETQPEAYARRSIEYADNLIKRLEEK